MAISHSCSSSGGVTSAMANGIGMVRISKDSVAGRGKGTAASLGKRGGQVHGVQVTPAARKLAEAAVRYSPIRCRS
jgi:hypothetical protein